MEAFEGGGERARGVAERNDALVRHQPTASHGWLHCRGGTGTIAAEERLLQPG